MFISDLSILEVVESAEIIGGGGFKIKNKFKEYIDRKIDLDIKKKVKIDVDVKGNFADAVADAQVSGKNTFSETIAAIDVVEGEYSNSYSSATGGTRGYYYKY